LLKWIEEKGKMKKLFSTLVIALLMVSMALITFSARAEGATIWTDKAEYGSNETVTIFGSGFLANAQVTIKITAPDSSVATIYAWTDESGGFVAYYTLDGMTGTYTVTATDGTNTATTTFLEPPDVAVTWKDEDCAYIELDPKDLDTKKSYTVTIADPDGTIRGTWTYSGVKDPPPEYFVLDISLPKVLGTWTVRLYEDGSLKKTKTVDVDKVVWTTDSTYATMKTSFAQGETVYFKAIGLLTNKYYRFRLDPPAGSSIYVGAWTTGVTTLTGSYVLPANAPTGSWKLHVRQADNAAGGGEKHYVDRYFTVTPYVPPPTATVTFSQVGVGSDFTGVVLTVDGKDYGAAAVAAGVAITKNVGESISFTYHSPLPVDTGKQYVWTSTEGLSSAQSETIIVPEGGGSVTAYYKTQYLVLFTQTGSGVAPTVTYSIDGGTPVSDTVPFSVWVDSGSSISYTYQDIVYDGAGTRYVLTGVSPSSPQTVTSSLTITGTYKTQYYLTVSSIYNSPTPTSGWFDAGQKITASVTSPWPGPSPKVQYVCTGWTGTGSVPASGTTTTVTFTINEPSSITWNWKVQYYLDVAVDPSTLPPIPGADWYDECTWVKLTAPTYLPSEEGIDGVRYKFSYWDVDGASQGVDVNPINVHMDAPHVATAHYTPQYYLTVKTDPEGLVTIPGSGWYDPGTEVTLTAPLEPVVNYLFAYWTVDDTTYLENSIKVTMDAPYTATAVYKDYLGHAREEIEALKTYLNNLRAAGKIGKHEYDYFMKALNAIEKDIARGMKQLDRERRGFNDRQKGFEDLRHAVMKIKRLIHQVENWAKKGKIPSSDAAWIISELETIRMKLVNKAWAEALAEKALALKAIAEAKALGKDTTKAETELIKVDRELAKAIQCINEGKYSQAIQHFKHAFTHSQHAVKKAYDPTWDTDYKDWIDELEEEEP
jgi:hypothetical protein